jgi:GAF domain-containing protein
MTQIHDLGQLLSQVTHLISQHFGFYHAGVFLVDEAGRYAVLRAANSPGGQRMLARHHGLGVGTEGIVGYVTGTGEPRVALDVGADAVYFDNPDMPDTRSEMALPLRVGDEIIGALDVQSTKEAAFDEEDVSVLTALADQIAIAIQNARLFQQSQVALEEAQQTHRRYIQQEWSQFTAEGPEMSYEYTLSGVPSVGNAALPEVEQAWLNGQLVVADPNGVHSPKSANNDTESPPLTHAALAAPIKLRDEIIGVLDLQETDVERVWTEDEIALVQAVADQLGQALEGARLFEETQSRAHREALTRQITDRIRDRSDVEAMLQTAIRELSQALRAPRVFVRLAPEALASDDGGQTTNQLEVEEPL